MRLLAIDIGSSSVKAAVLNGGKLVGRVARAPFITRCESDRAEVNADELLNAVAKAIGQLGAKAKSVDAIVHDAMGPSWVALDRSGRAVTPIVTHQDRRASAEAADIEKRVGRAKHLRIVGARPVPGGISSTTLLWHLRHARGAMKHACLVGHASTLLTHALTGARAIDPSQASFTGLFNTTTLSGWNDQLIDATGVGRALLPEVHQANEVVGRVTSVGARRFGVTVGTPVAAGILDGSAALLAGSTEVGQLMNVSGTTDVLALVIDKPCPHEQLLTRALGVGRKWLAVSTISAAGAALEWMHRVFFRELSDRRFYALVASTEPSDVVRVAPSFAGSRTSVEALAGSIQDLRLSTTREQILAGLLEALARASGERLALFRSLKLRMNPNVLVTGGTSGVLARVLRRDWPKRFRYRPVDQATLLGLAKLAPIKH
ncbi:MAG: FGGY family carbohydrate kinase [Tepidisphaeraceae bacterium]